MSHGMADGLPIKSTHYSRSSQPVFVLIIPKSDVRHTGRGVTSPSKYFQWQSRSDSRTNATGGSQHRGYELWLTSSPQRLAEAIQLYSGPLVFSGHQNPERQVSYQFGRPLRLTFAEFDLVCCKPPDPNAYIIPFTSSTNVPTAFPPPPTSLYCFPFSST